MGKRKTNGRYTVAQDGEAFCVLRAGKPHSTPMGNPLRTMFGELAEEVAGDLCRLGEDPESGISMYATFCSMLDFVPMAGRDRLIAVSVQAMANDPVLQRSADPEVMFLQMAAYSHPYFTEIQLESKSLAEVMEWAGDEMTEWSPQELMVVQLSAAHLGSPLMGMALAQDKANVPAAAFGFCGKFWQHRMESLGAFCIGGIPDFAPSTMDDSFCESHCLAASEDDDDSENAPTGNAVAETFRRCCGVAVAMDIWRRFATFGRNQRI